MAQGPFRRAFLGYRRADVDEAVAWRDAALEEESARADAETKRAESLEQVADRLAQRVVERERQIATLTARLGAAVDALRSAEVRVEDVADAPALAATRPSAEVFDGTVEVELGPLSDFGQLASFEDAANGIGGADEISVTGFTEGRATLEMQLSEPVELLRELEQRAPFEFTVRDTRGDRVILDVEAEAA